MGKENEARTDSSLDIVTINDYHKVMKGIRIADLKSHLSEHLRHVRRGRTLTILDRNTPIARMVPFKENSGLLQVRSPLPDSPKLQQIQLPPPLRRQKDIVTFLLKDRQVDR